MCVSFREDARQAWSNGPGKRPVGFRTGLPSVAYSSKNYVACPRANIGKIIPSLLQLRTIFLLFW